MAMRDDELYEPYKPKPKPPASGSLPNTGAPSPTYAPPSGPPPAGPTSTNTSYQPSSAVAAPTQDAPPTSGYRPGKERGTPPTQDQLPTLPGPAGPPPSGPPSAPPSTPPAPPAAGGALTQGDRGRFMELSRNYPPTTAGLDQLIREHPELGITRISSGDIRLPDGEIIDVIYAADIGGGRWQWLTGMSQTGGASAAGPVQVPVDPYQQQVRDIIMAQLADLSKPYDPNADPQFDITMGAANAQAEKVRRQKQAEAAERLTAQGYSVAGGGGALEGEIDELFNEQSYQLSGLAGEMVQRALEDRRQQMLTLLNMALASGDAATAQAVQLQIAAIDAELRRMGMSMQQSQFDDTMDLNWFNAQTGLI